MNDAGQLRARLNERPQTHPDGSHEFWRDVPGFEGYYRVSDRGRVKSLTRTVHYPPPDIRKRVIRGRLLNVFAASDGRTFVNLCKNNRNKSHRVCKLVLLAFVGPRPPGMECCHFPDRDPANNLLKNLRWDTRSGNVRDAIHHGTRFQPDNNGARSTSAKLTENDVRLIRRLYHEGWRICELSRKFPQVTRPAIGCIVHGKNWPSLDD